MKRNFIISFFLRSIQMSQRLLCAIISRNKNESQRARLININVPHSACQLLLIIIKPHSLDIVTRSENDH